MELKFATSFLSSSFAKPFKDHLGFASFMQVSQSVLGYLTVDLVGTVGGGGWSVQNDFIAHFDSKLNSESVNQSRVYRH